MTLIVESSGSPGRFRVVGSMRRRQWTGHSSLHSSIRHTFHRIHRHMSYALSAMSHPFEFSTFSNAPAAVRRSPALADTVINYFGHYDRALIVDRFVEFAKANGVEGDIEHALDTFLEHAEGAYILPEQVAVWASFQMMCQTDEWRIPRPHQDGEYWDSSLDGPGAMLPFKVGTVLAGPSTLFWDPQGCSNEDQRAAYSIVANEMYSRAKALGISHSSVGIREWVTAELDKRGLKTVAPTCGQAARWTVASDEHAAIHSEPDMSCMPDGRVLCVMLRSSPVLAIGSLPLGLHHSISLLPGTSEQVRFHAKRWDEPYVDRSHADNEHVDA